MKIELLNGFELKATALENKILPADFSEAVALLMRPYFPISEHVYNEIMDYTANLNGDILLIDNEQFAFGHADNGYALMPLIKNI